MSDVITMRRLRAQSGRRRLFPIPPLVWLFISFIAHSAGAAETAYQGFRSPTGIASIPGVATYVSDWSANTLTRFDAQGAKSVVATDIPAPAGLAVDKEGALFIASYSADYILKIAPDGSTRRVAENLSTPAGISFARDGRLLVANRGSGEVIAIDVSTGESKRVADSLALPVGIAEMDDGSIVVSQYGGGITRILRNGEKQEIGDSFNRPGVGILADGPDAVFAVDNGAGVVRRVAFDGTSAVIADDLAGSAVALGRGLDNELLVGAWGSGVVYRIRP
ncbi:serine/threonine protein kinase [Brenneria populi subsp. brevivirga]|uniref:Vgb family protein n=1 Tax=Brenneria populi TaxID=1505588 RepID=UPI002E185AAD|nr:serine/threonine protein kinase [Brenneria populi subsp. brevivirga]